jgi:O-antigen polymerase
MILSAILVAVKSDGFERFEQKAASFQTEYSNADRWGIYLVSFELVKEKPILGYGLGSFAGQWQFQKADYQARNPSYPLIQLYISHPHNELLLWQIEGGLVATLGILISFFTILVISIKSKALYALPLLFPIAFHNQVELPFHISAIMWFLCLLLIFMSVSHAKLIKVPINLSKMMRSSGAILVISAVITAQIFLISTLIFSREFVYATHKTPKRNADMSMALYNPYLSQMAEDFIMQNLFNISNVHQSIEGIREFNAWQQQAIKQHPTDFNFKLLIASYQVLDKKQEACQTAKIAHHMYHSNTEFKRYDDFCKSDLVRH